MVNAGVDMTTDQMSGAPRLPEKSLPVTALGRLMPTAWWLGSMTAQREPLRRAVCAAVGLTAGACLDDVHAAGLAGVALVVSVLMVGPRSVVLLLPPTAVPQRWNRLSGGGDASPASTGPRMNGARVPGPRHAWGGGESGQ